MNIKFIYFLVLLSLLFWGCEREVSTSPDYEEKINNSVLYLSSNPEGAMIYLDGKISGLKTPDSLVWLDDTSYVVSLKLNLFRDTTFRINFGANEVKDLYIDYSENPRMYGSIQCISTPEQAEIYLDGEFTGRYTPDTLRNLFPGKYKLTLKKEEHRDYSIDYTVTSYTTVGNTIALEDTSLWVTYTAGNSDLPSSIVNAVTLDDEENLWVGASEGGVIKITGDQWIIYNESNSPFPSDVSVNSLNKDRFGNIWIGTSDGLYKFSAGSWTYYDNNNSGLPGNHITCIEFDIHDAVWVGTNSGIGVLAADASWQTFTAQNSGLGSNNVTSINTNVNGERWAGTLVHGISRYYGVWKKIDNYYWEIGGGVNVVFPGSSTSSIAVDHINEIVWVGWKPETFPGGGGGGLTSYVNNKWQVKNYHLPSNYIKTIYIDNDNIKWIATDNGLVSFDDPSATTIYQAQYTGMYSNVINDVIKDSRGTLWIATQTGGLTKYKGLRNQ